MTLLHDKRPKFVVRFDDFTKRDSVERLAGEMHVSMNGYILQAIDEKIARGERIDKLLTAADLHMKKFS